MKSADTWRLLCCLLFLQAACLQGQEKSPVEEVIQMMREADEIRVVEMDSKAEPYRREFTKLTGYRCVVAAQN